MIDEEVSALARDKSELPAVRRRAQAEEKNRRLRNKRKRQERSK